MFKRAASVGGTAIDPVAAAVLARPPVFRYTLAAGLFVIALEAGCTSPPPRVLDRSELSRLHTIALAVPSEPSTYGLSSGSEATAIAIEIITGKPPDAKTYVHITGANQRDFKLAVLDDLHLGAELGAALSRVLQENGYKTSTVPVTLDKKGEFALDSLRDIDTDAVLYAEIIGAAYEDGPEGGPFAPSMKTRVQLIDRKSKKILLDQLYLYDAYADPRPPQTINTMRILCPLPVYRFDTVEQLLATPSLAAEGLRAAVPMMSDEIGKLLQSP